MNTIQTIRKNLAEWYEQHKRELPWRTTKNPYSIWISEVILQQTRVDQGTAYYHRFLERFPDVRSLAEAEEDEVLRLWQGLGYYSRARNLHKAAKQVMTDHRGQFPSNYDSIKSLKGVGPYTAAAISSIAFNLPEATVDGNVARVISRLFAVKEAVNKGPGSRMIDELAKELLDHENPSRHNQAMMEMGALQCVPVNPVCPNCMLNEVCEARAQDLVKELPVKIKNVKRRSRFFHYVVVSVDGQIALQQRGPKDIWEGLYEFPMIEKADRDVPTSSELKAFGIQDHQPVKINTIPKHVLSHQDIFSTFHHFQLDEKPEALTFVNLTDLSNFALPRLIDRYLEQHDVKSGEKT